ncbi:FixH family protein [Winogradskyella psychrotolerans]|uniref:FixH family protein n=1 Tax=Winogradskyella psychrotolerans TaxID=1344585 RepID=UPI001C06DA94|nr:FixH family protein [Winogradskyella psychrotolerans]MBU2929490.1 FixH family protein [Winogradskyella psychrotolerans]
MKKFMLFVATLCVVVTSCTLDKTDYESEISTVVTEYIEFDEVVSIIEGNYQIRINALNGTFYKGYNAIQLTITNTQTNESLNSSEVTFLPIMTNYNGNHTSGPHQYNLEYNIDDDYYAGYTVFTSETNDSQYWELYISFSDNGETYSVTQSINVEAQTNMNLNMTAFTGSDGEHYFIALVAPQKPKIAENELVAGIYKYNQPTGEAGIFPDPSQFSYSEVEDYTLLLDPRMPEPSMGNHSSPNNEDLTQQDDGLYYGVVNYTMTGNWTLNFRLQNSYGEIIKGTEVSTEFTPGIEGARSELHIDILF